MKVKNHSDGRYIIQLKCLIIYSILKLLNGLREYCVHAMK